MKEDIVLIGYPAVLIAALVSAVAPATASAQDAVAIMRAVPGRNLMLVIGRLGDGFADQLARELERNPTVRAIDIESGGGLSDEARKAAMVLNRRQITLRVPGMCASACALLWAATDQRQIIGRGRIGVHAGRPRKRPPWLLKEIVRARNERMYVDPLKHAGFSDAMIAKARATPPESMLWLSADDLRLDGVHFKLLPR